MASPSRVKAIKAVEAIFDRYVNILFLTHWSEGWNLPSFKPISLVPSILNLFNLSPLEPQKHKMN
jgi:hypothetical protein